MFSFSGSLSSNGPMLYSLQGTFGLGDTCISVTSTSNNSIYTDRLVYWSAKANTLY
jgi:hypothetical protein